MSDFVPVLKKQMRDHGLFWFGVGVFSVLAVFLRVWHPLADAPFDLDFSQGTNTDGAWYLNKALAMVGGAYLDPGLLQFYNKPLITAYALCFFKLFGHGLAQINLLNVIPGLAAILFLTTACYQSAGRRTAFLVFVLASCNFLLVFFSRVPLIYIWMCVFEAGLAALWQMNIRKARLQPVVWAGVLTLTIVLAVLYKFFILLFLPCLILAQATEKKDGHTISVLKITAASVIAAVVLLFAVRHFDPNGWANIQSYIGRYSSRADVFERLWRFWKINETFLYTRMPMEFFFAYIGCLTLIYRRFVGLGGDTFFDRYMVAVFLVGHAIVLGFNYAPIRYYLILVPTALYLGIRCFTLMVEMLHQKQNLKKGALLFAICAVWALPIASLVMKKVLHDALLFTQVPLYLLGTLGLSFIGGATAFLLFRALAKLPPITEGLNDLLPVVLTALMLVPSLYHYIDWRSDLTYTIRNSRNDIRQMLPENAVIIGPYAHLFAIGAPYKAFSATVETHNPASFLDQLRRFKVTHIAIDIYAQLPSYQRFLDANPECLYLDSLFIRGVEVRIYRLPQSKEIDNFLPLSLFEQGALAMREGDLVQARTFWEQSNRDFPEAGAAARALARLAEQEKRPVAERDTARELAMQRNPAHPLPWQMRLEDAVEKRQRLVIVESASHVMKLTTFHP